MMANLPQKCHSDRNQGMVDLPDTGSPGLAGVYRNPHSCPCQAARNADFFHPALRIQKQAASASQLGRASHSLWTPFSPSLPWAELTAPGTRGQRSTASIPKGPRVLLGSGMSVPMASIWSACICSEGRFPGLGTPELCQKVLDLKGLWAHSRTFPNARLSP